MQSESASLPELNCQWCSGTISSGSTVCSRCGASRPREDLVASGFTEPQRPAVPTTEHETEHAVEEEARARQLLQELDASYVPEATPGAQTVARDPGEDAMVIIGIFVIGGVVGGVAGWFLAAPLLHEFFHDVIGVESEGAESFRRLGAFVGALISMLFGALLATIIRR